MGHMNQTFRYLLKQFIRLGTIQTRDSKILQNFCFSLIQDGYHYYLSASDVDVTNRNLLRLNNQMLQNKDNVIFVENPF